MTEHEKLMLRRHLETAARTYERRAQDLLSSHPFGQQGSFVAEGYLFLTQDARRLAEMLKEKG
jgi:23S rRNA maturation mini-RNase III